MHMNGEIKPRKKHCALFHIHRQNHIAEKLHQKSYPYKFHVGYQWIQVFRWNVRWTQKKRIGFVCSTIEMNWQQSPFVCAVHASKVCLRMTMLVCLCVFFQFPLQHSPVFINGFQLFFDWNVCALSALSEWRVSWLRIDWKPFWLVCRANCIILDCMRLYDMDIILSIHKTATNKQKTKRNKKCSSPFQMG